MAGNIIKIEDGAKQAAPRLTVKDENIHMMVVNADPKFDYDVLSPEDQAIVDENENTFIDKQLRPALLNLASNICGCRGMEMQQRAMVKAQLMAAPGPVQIELTQNDVDAMKFGVVTRSNGLNVIDSDVIISQCKLCSSIHIFGNVEVLTRAFAEALRSNMDNAPVIPVDPVPSGEYIMEDVETGEITRDCGDLGEVLFGKPDDSLKVTEAE